MILERLKQYIDSKGLAISAFERSIGMSNASFSKSLKNGGAIGTDKLENILSVYADLSVVWLLTGKGAMITQPTESVIAKSTENDMISKLLDMIREKDTTIQQQATEIGSLRERLTQMQNVVSNATVQDARVG